MILPRATVALLAALAAACWQPARAESTATARQEAQHATTRHETRHEAWQACLSESFALQAALSSRTLAADAALRACRPSEEAYLAALATSPLLDADDVTQARPALLARARGWLLNGRPSRSL